jgi:large subunit ribosomal protein L18e
MRRTFRKKNEELIRTVVQLERAAKKYHAPIWSAVADRLMRSRHHVKPVNVGHLERLANPKETLLVPGKVLSSGRLTKTIVVAAFQYSEGARSKIHAAGGKAITIGELIQTRPDGTGVRIFA